MQQPPGPIGLYDPRNEHDSCGVSFVANLNGVRSNELVLTGLTALTNMEHRGATGAEPDTGDGAGILMQVPDRFLREVVDFDLPEAGAYAVGVAFLPVDGEACGKAMAAIEVTVAEAGLTTLGWRDVPVDPASLGATARAAMPTFKQLFVSDPAGTSGLELDRKAFVARKRSRRELEGDLETYFASLSSRTIVYKGMLTTPQLSQFFPDLLDPRVESALLIVHSRFSTNTFPSWPLAHPYRFVAHNGEINTVQGNQNWMRAREAMLRADLLPGIERTYPICTPGASDTARFDEVLEVLCLGGYPIHHAMLMMIPEAWENHETMPQAQRDFYRFHATMMEPWDGPASVAFTDGEMIGAVLDRNGLRPSRYWVTDDDVVVMASEVGVIDIDPSRVVAKGRLQPGKMFLIDTRQGRIVADDEIKSELASLHPYGEWLAAGMVELADLPEREHIVFSHDSVLRRQQMFGYTHEELKIILTPMAATGGEALGSMGTDTPLAVLSERPRLLFDYFTQLFAQVTNPPLDAIREEVVTAVSSSVGPEANLLAPGPESCRQLALPFPIIDNDELAKIIHINDEGAHPGLQAKVLSGLYRVADGGNGLRTALDAICRQASEAIENGARILVLSDRNADSVDAPIPSLLLTAAVHHHLVRTKQRTMAGLIVESGDAREVHHMALLIGYGAGAVNPYLAFESIEDLIAEDMHGLGAMDPHKAVANYIKACGKGVLKVMSKMGVSTVASYTGAQIFEAIGLGQPVIDAYFTGTISQLGGIGLDEIAAEVGARHAMANPSRPEERAHRKLELGGEYQWRREGELHLFNPETVFKLQHATRAKRYDIFKEYTARVDDQSEKLMTLRGLFEFSDERRPIPIDEVEPTSEIVKRFSTGAMSYGSISAEAHETLAIAMNRLGAKSNTGEGGEDVDRLYDPERRSAIKQVASGRFGVTSEYLTNADDLQIKMAQGAKPGEGGQLPGHKVYPWIAATRHSTPGVGLISPPPHHDIYSIEDLKQLIHDLKNANPAARVHVKLVAETGVGTVAAGVSKAKADVVLISGHDGGTGASPLTSLKHAGGPWELGLAETQQTLLLNGLRDRIVVQTDGQMKTGSRRRDRGAARRGGVRLRHGAARRVRLHHDAGLSSRHLPGRGRHAEPRVAGSVQRSTRVRRDVLRVHRHGGPRADGRTRLSHDGRDDRPRRAARHASCCVALEGVGARHRTDSRDSPEPVRPDDDPERRPGSRSRRGARPAVHRTGAAGHRRRPPRVDRSPGAQRQPHGRHPARPRSDEEVEGGGPPGRNDRHHAHRFGGPEPRCIRAVGHPDPSGRRRQRLRGQGSVRWADHRAPAPVLAVRRRGPDHRRQRDRLRRDRWRDLPPRQGRRTLLCAQLGSDRRQRRCRRPRLRVHDRRSRRGARPDRAQLRCRHVRRHRLRVRPDRGVRQQGELRHGRPRGSRRERPRVPRRPHRSTPEPHRIDGGRPHPAVVGRRSRCRSAR